MRTNYISENIKTLYSLVWGQRTDILRQKIEALHDFEEMSTNGDGLALLKAIKNTAFNFHSQKYLPHSLYESTWHFYMTVQGKYMTTQAYLEQFQNMIDVIGHTGGMVGHQPGIERDIMRRERSIDPTNATTMQQMEIEKEAQKGYLAVAFMLGSDKARFGRLLENLENDYLQGQNNYPTSITAAYNLLTNWKQDPRNLIRTSGPVSNGVLFTNVDGEHGEQDIEVSLKLDESGKIPKSWILLDNQSTVDVFYNANLLRNIRKGEKHMDIHCNAGVTSTNLVGDLPGYGTVWYHPNGIANILSLAKMQERGYHIKYDSKDGNEFIIFKPDGSMRRVFKQSDRGLYFMDSKMASTTEVTLVNTVDNNRSNYTNRDYSHAVLPRQLQKIIGRPSTRTFTKTVENNLLPNCPVTQRDIMMAEDIIGPDVGSLKGKSTRRGTDHVAINLIDTPASIMNHYKNIILGGDIMFVSKIPFFVTISHHHVKFGTAEMLQNQ